MVITHRFLHLKFHFHTSKYFHADLKQNAQLSPAFKKCPNNVSSLHKEDDYHGNLPPVTIPDNIPMASEDDIKTLLGRIESSLQAACQISKGGSRIESTETETYDYGKYLHFAVNNGGCYQFLDDVEMVLTTKDRLLHYRSASRVGNTDLGKNRLRMNNFVDQMSRNWNNEC